MRPPRKVTVETAEIQPLQVSPGPENIPVPIRPHARGTVGQLQAMGEQVDHVQQLALLVLHTQLHHDNVPATVVARIGRNRVELRVRPISSTTSRSPASYPSIA